MYSGLTGAFDFLETILMPKLIKQQIAAASRWTVSHTKIQSLLWLIIRCCSTSPYTFKRINGCSCTSSSSGIIWSSSKRRVNSCRLWHCAGGRDVQWVSVAERRVLCQAATKGLILAAERLWIETHWPKTEAKRRTNPRGLLRLTAILTHTPVKGMRRVTGVKMDERAEEQKIMVNADRENRVSRWTTGVAGEGSRG